MKNKLIIITVLLTVISVFARIITPFRGWNWVKEHSSYIIVAIAKNPTPPTPGQYVENAPNSDSSISVLSFLKGTNGLGYSRLLTDHELRKGEAYLIFGDFDNGIYRAYEDYRVVPLGITFKQDMIAGKPLNEQIQVLFQLGEDYLKADIAKKQAEKDRLETGDAQH
jgi:hypothetical protein